MKTNKKGISLIVLVITIIVMIILATAIILSISGSDVRGKAEEAVNTTDLATAKEIIAVAQSEWELNYDELSDKYDNVGKYAQSKLDKQNIKLNGLYLTEKGDLIEDSIISYVEYLKKQKGAMKNWDDISATLITPIEGMGVKTDKGFKFEYNGEEYLYIYQKSFIDSDNSSYYNSNEIVESVLGVSSMWTSNISASKLVLELPEGITYITGGGFYEQVYAVIYPESLTQFDGGIFYASPNNLKEIKINGTLTSIAGCGIEETDCPFPQDCRIFYKGTEMTVKEFTDLF